MYLSKIWNLQYGHVQIYAKYAPPKVGWKMVKKLLFLRIVCTQKWRNFQSRFLWSQQCACVDKIFKALLSKYANLRISYKTTRVICLHNFSRCKINNHKKHHQNLCHPEAYLCFPHRHWRVTTALQGGQGPGWQRLKWYKTSNHKT